MVSQSAITSNAGLIKGGQGPTQLSSVGRHGVFIGPGSKK